MPQTNEALPVLGRDSASEDRAQAAKLNTLRDTNSQVLQQELDGRYWHSALCEQLARSGLFGRAGAHMLLAVARMPEVPNCDLGACRPADRANDPTFGPEQPQDCNFRGKWRKSAIF
jgi:hypothetical protein